MRMNQDEIRFVHNGGFKDQQVNETYLQAGLLTAEAAFSKARTFRIGWSPKSTAVLFLLMSI